MLVAYVRPGREPRSVREEIFDTCDCFFRLGSDAIWLHHQGRLQELPPEAAEVLRRRLGSSLDYILARTLDLEDELRKTQQ